MKNIAASVGLVALGASTLHAAYDPGLGKLEKSKPWSVSATVRGFYDDNVGTTKDNEVESWGYEINPYVGVHWVGDQTMVSAGYGYSGKYYEERPAGESDKWSQSHTFDAQLQHAFNPRLNLNARDSFVIGQEPDQLRAGNSFETFQHISGDNVRNYGLISVSWQITPLFGLMGGYDNTYWNYDDSGASLDSSGNIVASWSGLLDRIEHSPFIDTRWQFSPQTVGIVGYRYRQVEFTGDEPIQGTAFFYDTSSIRNYRSHYGYVGVEHSFRPDLSGSLKAGARYTESYKDPSNPTDWGPYFQADLTYEASSNTRLGVGLSHDFSTTDQVGSNGQFIQGIENTVGYLWFRHQIAPSLYLGVTGTAQYSVFQGGGPVYDGESEWIFLAGINLEYNFNEHFSAQLGYNFDTLDSDIQGRGFDRNRFYFGVTAAY